MAKSCSTCKETKPASEFYADKRRPDGLKTQCKRCHTSASSRSRRKNWDQHLAQIRAAYAANPDGRRESRRRWMREHPEINRRGAHNRRARLHQVARVPFTEQQLAARLSMFTGCGLCGQPIVGEVHIDHVKPLSRGGPHCLSNLQPAHPACNARKNNRWGGVEDAWRERHGWSATRQPCA